MPGAAETEVTVDRGSPFAQRPVLVFWETTRACLLACRHCRAEAQRDPLPGELSLTEARRLLQQIADFGRPAPVVIFTGGDVLMRPDIFRLLDLAGSLGLRVAVAPSATPLLEEDAFRQFADAGVHSLSLSLDGPEPVHDGVRGVPGTYRAVVRAIRQAHDAGLAVQINTVVMRSTAEHLADVAALLLEEGIRVWEVFYLIATGRALAAEYLAPQEWDDVCRFLLDTTRWGLLVRTVEGPFVRRVHQQSELVAEPAGALYHRLRAHLEGLAGSPIRDVQMTRAGTLDGDGIVFVGYDGTITPGGFLPVPLGNVRTDHLVDVYRSHPLLNEIRARRFVGPCGTCSFRRACGGSRARAFAATGDPLGSDPACAYLPRA